MSDKVFKRSQAAHVKQRDKALERGDVGKAMYHAEMYIIQAKNERVMPRNYRAKVYQTTKKKYKEYEAINGLLQKKLK